MSWLLSGFWGLFVRFKIRRSGGFPWGRPAGDGDRSGKSCFAGVPAAPRRKIAAVRNAQGIEAEYPRAGVSRPGGLEREARSGPGRLRPKGEVTNYRAFSPAGDRAFFLS
jgi:hypothetical protein